MANHWIECIEPSFEAQGLQLPANPALIAQGKSLYERHKRLCQQLWPTSAPRFGWDQLSRQWQWVWINTATEEGNVYVPNGT